jgi:hypothetical protein
MCVHHQGAINVPLFREVQGNSPFDITKKLVMAGFAMTATGQCAPLIVSPLCVRACLGAFPKKIS